MREDLGSEVLNIPGAREDFAYIVVPEVTTDGEIRREVREVKLPGVKITATAEGPDSFVGIIAYVGSVQMFEESSVSVWINPITGERGDARAILDLDEANGEIVLPGQTDGELEALRGKLAAAGIPVFNGRFHSERTRFAKKETVGTAATFGEAFRPRSPEKQEGDDQKIVQ